MLAVLLFFLALLPLMEAKKEDPSALLNSLVTEHGVPPDAAEAAAARFLRFEEAEAAVKTRLRTHSAQAVRAALGRPSRRALALSRRAIALEFATEEIEKRKRVKRHLRKWWRRWWAPPLAHPEAESANPVGGFFRGIQAPHRPSSLVEGPVAVLPYFPPPSDGKDQEEYLQAEEVEDDRDDFEEIEGIEPRVGDIRVESAAAKDDDDEASVEDDNEEKEEEEASVEDDNKDDLVEFMSPQRIPLPPLLTPPQGGGGDVKELVFRGDSEEQEGEGEGEEEDVDVLLGDDPSVLSYEEEEEEEDFCAEEDKEEKAECDSKAKFR